jgi:hypothetical protein
MADEMRFYEDIFTLLGEVPRSGSARRSRVTVGTPRRRD